MPGKFHTQMKTNEILRLETPGGDYGRLRPDNNKGKGGYGTLRPDNIKGKKS